MQTNIKAFFAQDIQEDITSSDHLIERIFWNNQPLVYIIRAGVLPEKTTFLTPPEFKQQIGFIVYPQGGEIARHIHRNLERNLIGTSEVLIVYQGRCEIDIFNNGQELVATRVLQTGDIMLMVGGTWFSVVGRYGFFRSQTRAIYRD